MIRIIVNNRTYLVVERRNPLPGAKRAELVEFAIAGRATVPKLGVAGSKLSNNTASCGVINPAFGRKPLGVIFWTIHGKCGDTG